MAPADTIVPRSARPDLRRLLLRHPELGPAAVVAAAWVTLLVLAAAGHGSASAAGAGVMPGMAMDSSAARPAARPSRCARLP